MKLFRKIAKAAGAAAKKDKEDAPLQEAEAAGAQPMDFGDAKDGSAAGKEAARARADDTAAESTADSAVATAKDGPLASADAVRLRARYNALQRENEDLKQRNKFLLQLLAVSQLDEKQLDAEIQQRRELLDASYLSSEASPTYKKMIAPVPRRF